MDLRDLSHETPGMLEAWVPATAMLPLPPALSALALFHMSYRSFAADIPLALTILPQSSAFIRGYLHARLENGW